MVTTRPVGERPLAGLARPRVRVLGPLPLRFPVVAVLHERELSGEARLRAVFSAATPHPKPPPPPARGRRSGDHPGPARGRDAPN